MASPLNEKRVVLAIVLATLTGTAYLTASGTTQIVAAAILDTPADEAGAAPPRRARGAAPAAEAPERPARHDIACAVLERDIFDHSVGRIECNPPPPPPPDEGGEAEEAPPPIIDPSNAPPCEGSIRLVASYYRPREPDQSFAAITDASGAVLLYGEGQTVDDRTVFLIARERVFLQPSGASLCYIGMFQEGERVATERPVVAAPIRVDPVPAASEGGIEASELDTNIQQLSETSYVINRSLVDRLLANQAELMRTARVIPHEVDGRVVGVKIYGIRRSSLLGRLGIQNGDMLRTINGFDLSSPDSVLEAYTRLRTADRLSLTLERRGQSMSMDYAIQ